MNPALRHSAAHVFVESLDAPELSPDDAHHLFRVLRVRDGEVVTVSDGVGGWRAMRAAGGALVPDGPVEREPAPAPCTIAAAIPKGDRAEWMVQKLTEIGVSEIVLLHCARSVVRWEGERGAKQLARLQRVAREAAVQSRRVWLPVVRGPVTFAEAAALPGAMLAEPDGARGVAGSTVIIGPEGGFSAEELAAPLPRRRLVDTVLRVETAAIVAASGVLDTD
ncbi:MAG: putative ribosomal small subunit methyltransferase [Actinomycetota bacterium]